MLRGHALPCRYIEQVTVALRGRERAVETIQALLRSCRAKTVSSAAAMHQVCKEIPSCWIIRFIVSRERVRPPNIRFCSALQMAL